jgi:hypothetical protein
MILWMVLLIIQPIFIIQKKHYWHRTIGKTSYFIVPLMGISMFLVYKNQFTYDELGGIPCIQNLGILFYL